MELASTSSTDCSSSPIDFRGELNREQLTAVSSDPGPALVLAGAGSGKTRTLTYRVAWLLTQGVPPQEILLLTFTNKAANEMLRRVEDLTGVTGSKFWGGTFHHIGNKTLRLFGEDIGLQPNFTILDQKDSEALLKETIQEVDSLFLKGKSNPKTGVIAAIISFARNTQTSIEDVISRKFPFNLDLVELIERFSQAYKRRKLLQQVTDFDDLLVYWLEVLKSKPDIAAYFQNRFKQVLIDEYQDTNRLQSEIIDTIGAHHRIMAVGDDAQCIYTWRGANYKNIITFSDRHPETVIYKIETNYRSTPQILKLANGVLASQPLKSGYRKELRAVRSPGETPFLVQLMDGRLQAQFIINRIEGLVDEGYRLSDIGILYRAHYQALDIQVELSRLGIPFIITSGVRFFEQAHVRDFVAQLRFATNPNDQSAFLRFACLLQKVGERTAQRTFSEISQTAAVDKISPFEAMLSNTIASLIPPVSREEWMDLAHSMRDIHEAIASESPSEVVRIATEGWYNSFIRNLYPNWQSRMEDLESLIGFAGRFEEMSELLAQLTLLNSETADRSIDIEDDFLRLTTVHQAKGLEYPVVFVIGLADGLFPIKRALDEGNLDEERRLFYVAVTRAKNELYLTYPRINSQSGYPMRLKPSRFVSELPREHYEILRWHKARGW